MNTLQQKLLDMLQERFGNVRQCREKHGLHFYIPCPACLRRHGMGEKRKRHLSINVDQLDAVGNTRACFCNKCGEKFELRYLLGGMAVDMANVPTIGRNSGPEIGFNGPKGMFAVGETVFSEENKIVVPPGECVTLYGLPQNHPAIAYLTARGFDPAFLAQTYSAQFCLKGTVFGDDGTGGLPVTNRIILYGKMKGIVKAWQARIVEVMEKDTGNIFFLNPQGNYTLLSTPEDRARKMSRVKVAKYLTSMGASRAGILINLDTAIAASLKQGWDRAVVLCEGMLDAARVGAMGVPLLGKSLSSEQSRILKAHCDRVVVLLDADAQEDAKKIEYELKGLKVNSVTIPGVKDPGDATTDVIWREIGKVTGLNFNPIAI